MTRIGISVDRWWRLRGTDDNDAFEAWAMQVVPAFFRAREMQALDESLTRWRTDNYYPHCLYRRPLLPLDEVPTYTKYVTTPPARPEWLEVLP
jgi:hypothetical protein